MSPKPTQKGGMPMHENVIPIRKADKFVLTKGHVSDSGELIEGPKVGVAYLKPGSSMFRLRLWMFPSGEYFLARKDNDHSAYMALCREEFAQKGEVKNQWHKIGTGEVLGNFVRIRFHLFAEDIYLCLFPKGRPEEKSDVA